VVRPRRPSLRFRCALTQKVNVKLNKWLIRGPRSRGLTFFHSQQLWVLEQALDAPRPGRCRWGRAVALVAHRCSRLGSSGLPGLADPDLPPPPAAGEYAGAPSSANPSGGSDGAVPVRRRGHMAAAPDAAAPHGAPGRPHPPPPPRARAGGRPILRSTQGRW